MPRKTSEELRQEMTEELRELMLQLEEMKAMTKAYEHIIVRASELKWLAEKFEMNGYAVKFSEIINDAIQKKKNLKKSIEKYEVEVENLRRKIGRVDLW